MGDWQRSFVATRVALGASVDDAMASLPAEADPDARELGAALADASRAVRARALATALAAVAVDVERMRLL